MNKKSNLLTITPEFLLPEIQERLAQEGLFFGYQPLGDPNLPMSHYLKQRIANLFYYRYGSLSDLVSSAKIELKNGKSFCLKDAPRSATGPDFNKIIIGSNDAFGKILSVTLKVYQQPQKDLIGIIQGSSSHALKSFLREMISQFIQPKYFFFLNQKQTETFLKNHKIKKHHHESLVFCLSGIEELVSTEQAALEDFGDKSSLQMEWIDDGTDESLFEHSIYDKEFYLDIKKQYQEFLWPTSDQAQQNRLGEEMMESMKHV